MTKPDVRLDKESSGAVLRFSGNLVTGSLHLVEAAAAQIVTQPGISAIDVSSVETLDTAGAYFLVKAQKKLAVGGSAPKIIGATEDRARLIEKVASAVFDAHSPGDQRPSLSGRVEDVGRAVVAGFAKVADFLTFIGLVISRLVRTVFQPKRLRVTALFAQMQQTGYNAVPIIALMGFLIGIVLAFQGAVQLRQFGAEVFVVDLIAVSVLRELGILLTAIIVAGRSGSAYTAAIGSMKVHEEIDAMKTLGLDPIEVLVLPRLIALVLMLPVLGLVANICALFGGAMMSWLELGVSPNMYVTRLRENTDVWHLGVGMIKAPFFAFTIAVVACWQGFQVVGSADSVGEKTRSSVVQGIFLVIVLDALFSVFSSEIGI
ncbi:MAG: ABC transporter permease [Roseobacter sp.]